MKRYLGVLGILFSIALNAAFVSAYAYQRVTAAQRQTFAYEELHLSPAQQAQWLSGRDRFIEQVNRIGSHITGLQLDLIDAVAANPLDRNRIEAVHAQIRARQQEMQQAVVEHLLGEKTIITPEQQRKFFDVLKARIQAESRPGPPWIPRDSSRQR
jgi:Spy/CpxP family protein refolding chaperone